MRPQIGQQTSAANLRALLAGSPIVASHRYGDDRVQDAYSLRCTPQVHGAARDTVEYATAIADRELRSFIDNPVVLPDGRVESCGNFHGAPIGCGRRLPRHLDRRCRGDQRAAHRPDARSQPSAMVFRRSSAPDAGVNSGLMIAHYTQAAMVAENRRLAVPASTDTLPTSAMQEDHVSLGWSAAPQAAHGSRQPGPRPRRRADRRGRGGSRCGHRWNQQRYRSGCRGGARRRRGTWSGRVARAAPRRGRTPGHRRVGAGGGRRRASQPICGAREWQSHRCATLVPWAPVLVPSVLLVAPQLSCRGWPQEAAYRMLQNNLDPEVAERPDDLVVYGGTGRAARSWEAFDAMLAHAAHARRRRDDARAVGQAGRRLPHPRVGAAGAPRQLQPRSGLGDVGRVPPARGGRTDDVRADDGRLVDLHRHARDPAGHVRVLRRDRPPALRRDVGGDDHPDRRARAAWVARSRWRSR